MYREIPEGSVEAQTGLWAYLNTFTHNGTVYSNYLIYSSEGYCFYEVNQPENYDEEGNLKPAEERIYATYCITAFHTIDEVNANFISVPYQEGYEVVQILCKEPKLSMLN